MKLYVIRIGRINLPDKGHMTPGSGVGQPISMPAYCYLIEHDKGVVLVDLATTYENYQQILLLP